MKPNRGESPAEFVAREVRREHRPPRRRWLAVVAAAGWGAATWFAWTTGNPWPRDWLMLGTLGAGAAGAVVCRGFDRLVCLLAAVGTGLLAAKLAGW